VIGNEKEGTLEAGGEEKHHPSKKKVARERSGNRMVREFGERRAAWPMVRGERRKNNWGKNLKKTGFMG